MTSNDIYQSLVPYLQQPYTYVLPNVYVGRFERDVICLNKKSCYWSEYEIKVSRSDFKQDLKKGYQKSIRLL